MSTQISSPRLTVLLALALVLALGLAPFASQPAAAAGPTPTIVVNVYDPVAHPVAWDAPDADLGDGVCDTDITDGGTVTCSLRAAIENANLNADLDVIGFALTGPNDGSHYLYAPASALPAITQPVFIDGYSQTGSGSGPIIVLNGAAAGGGAHGFTVNSGGVTIQGFVIQAFGGDGIRITSASGSNEIYGNYIGTDKSGGSGSVANGVGLRISNSPANTIGGSGNISGYSVAKRNIISGNTGVGVIVTGASSVSNAVVGNLIGTQINGTVALANGADGVQVINAPNTVIGGSNAGEGNTISANGDNGLEITGADSSGTSVLGNRIGIAGNGTGALGNATNGVFINNVSGVTVGGLTAGGRNFIGSNGSNGISLGATADNITIVGNYIGLASDGLTARANGSAGINATGTGGAIGGTAAGSINVISGNSANGINITGSGYTIRGNYIGVAADGSTALANGTNGVRLAGSDNAVGGTAAGSANVIARNSADGVLIAGGTGNTVLGNSIYSNGDLGIDLNDGVDSLNGVTPNDANDTDAGANNTQNFPVLTTASISGGDLTVDGTLDSALGVDFRIEFFSNTACDGSGNGEGRTYLGSATVQSGGFSEQLTGVGVSEGAFITATATRLLAPTDTSEFSGCVAASSAPVAGLFVINSRLDDPDNNPGDGICATAGAVCTLRAAIMEANALGGSDPYNFSFNISTVNQTIQPATALPVITVRVVIDGTTEPDYSGTTPAIKLDGLNAPGGTNGLVFNAAGSSVRGLAIIRWPGAAVHLNSNDNTVSRNYIGVDTDGTTARGNGVGVLVSGAGNTIGSTTAANRNIIAANTTGVQLLGAGATGNSVIGNYIGLRADGGGTLGNTTGVLIDDAPANTVGGTSASQRNVISGNTNGVVIQNSGAAGNMVYGNYIGVNPGGTLDYGNTADGVRINNAPSNLIGTTGGGGNIISGNDGDGVEVLGGASGTQIVGNSIGVDSGAASRPNGAAGINISNGNNSIIQNNTIAYNVSDGVGILSGTGNLITANSIFSNTGLGIDLGANGVQANDSGDGDSGANNLQNYPFITLAGPLGGSTTLVEGLFNSTPSTTFTLDFYRNTACDPTNFGEGATFMGSGNVTTNGSGDGDFSIVVNASSSIGNFITATARDASGNTSEFSLCYQVVAAAPTLTPTNTSTPTETLVPSATFTPTNTLTPTRTNTPVPTATRTPTRTNTPAATNTSTGGGGGAVNTATLTLSTATSTVTGTPPTSTPIGFVGTGTITPGGPTVTPTFSLFIASNTPTSTPGEGTGGGALETAEPTSTSAFGLDTATPALSEFEIQLTALSDTATAESAGGGAAAGGGFPMWILWLAVGFAVLLLLGGGVIELIRWLNSRQG